MTYGYSNTKADIDQRLGSCFVSTREALRNCQLVKAWLDTQTDAALIALGYTQAEVNSIRSGMTDLDKLRQIFEGTATQASAYDFRQFAKLFGGSA